MITIKSGSIFTLILAFKDDTHIPVASLTPDITIYKVSDNSKVVDAQEMTEIGNGLYKYSFNAPVSDEGYAVYADGGATLTTYRYQFGAFYANWGNEDTIETINTAITTNLDVPVSSVADGNGSFLVEHRILNMDNQPIPNVPVWLTSTTARNAYVGVIKDTNSDGYRVWKLKEGLYYVWIAGIEHYTGTIQVLSDGTYNYTEA